MMVQIRISYRADQEYLEIMEVLEKKLEIKGVRIQKSRKPYKRAYIEGEWLSEKMRIVYNG
jgi:hypothetical protein